MSAPTLRRKLAKFDGEPSRARFLVNFPPNDTLSKLFNSPKGVSSRRMRQEFPDLRRHHWRAIRLSFGSHFAGPVGGAPVPVLRQYIEQQNRPGWARPGLPAPRVRLHHRP
jgi:putative transposase